MNLRDPDLEGTSLDRPPTLENAGPPLSFPSESMTARTRRSRLSDAHQIGVLGATRGDLRHLFTVLDTLWSRGVGTVLVLGDFGFIWPRDSRSVDLDGISVQLTARGQVLFFGGGNHEDFGTLSTFPVSKEGLRWVRRNIAHLPRGYRILLASGSRFAALSGANLIDGHRRVEGRTRWPEDSITDKDLSALGRV